MVTGKVNEKRWPSRGSSPCRAGGKMRKDVSTCVSRSHKISRKLLRWSTSEAPFEGHLKDVQYCGIVALQLSKWLNRQLKRTTSFHAEEFDTISILHLLFSSEMARDTNKMYRRATIWIFHLYMKGLMASGLYELLSLTGPWHTDNRM